MMEYGLSKVIGADSKTRALEKRFKEATPNLVLNRKGTFDYENRPDGQVINHFENVTFTTKDLLTKSLLKRCGENIQFYPESVLYNDIKDRTEVEEKYYKSLLISLTSLILDRHQEENVLGEIHWLKGTTIVET